MLQSAPVADQAIRDTIAAITRHHDYDRSFRQTALDRFLDLDYGAATFAEFAAKRLGVEFDANDFVRSDFTEAETTARTKASRQIQTQVIESLEENLGSDIDEKFTAGAAGTYEVIVENNGDTALAYQLQLTNA